MFRSPSWDRPLDVVHFVPPQNWGGGKRLKRKMEMGEDPAGRITARTLEDFSIRPPFYRPFGHFHFFLFSRSVFCAAAAAAAADLECLRDTNTYMHSPLPFETDLR